MIDSFFEFSFMQSLSESLERWYECDSSFEEIRDIFIEECLIFYRDARGKKVHKNILKSRDHLLLVIIESKSE